MKTHGTPLHGTYFDLLEDKYPDLAKPSSSRRQVKRPRLRARRRRSAAPIALLAAAAIAVAGLAVALRPKPAPSAVPATPPPAVSPSVEAPRRAEVSPEQPPAALETTQLPPPALEEPSRKPPEPTAASFSRDGRGRPLPLGEGRGEGLPRAATATAPAEPRPEPVYQPPRKIFSAPPEYPASARQAGEEGTVVVAARVDETGAVTGARVVRGRSPALDRAAAEAIATWRFEPATRGGEPVASSYRVGFEFTLRDPPAPTAAQPTKAEERRTPLEVGGDVKPPQRLKSPLPAYPDAAWAEGVTGDVLVRAVIDERGEIADVEVLKGLPYGMTEAAVEAIRRWKFIPATRHGQPVAVYRNLSVRFET